MIFLSAKDFNAFSTVRLSLHIARPNLNAEILIGFQKLRLISLMRLKSVACSASVNWFVSSVLLAHKNTWAISIFFAMKLLLSDDFVMLAGFFNFTGSDKIADFLSNCRVRNIKLAHDVFVKNCIVIMVLDIAKDSRSINISERQIKSSFQFGVIFCLPKLFYTLLKYLSKK